MKSVKYIIVVIAIVVAAWLYRLNRLAQRLQVFNNLEVFNLDARGINLNVNSTIKNPTNVRLSITTPFVTLYLPGEDKPLTSSNLTRGGIIQFDADSQNVLSIKIPIPYDMLPNATEILANRSIDVEITARFGIFKIFRFTRRETVQF